MNLIAPQPLRPKQPKTTRAWLDDANRLRQIKPRRFWSKLILLSLLMLTFGSGAVMSAGLTKLAFQFCLGLLYAHAVELAHQCIHQLATGRRLTDQFLGRLLSWPAGVSFWHYLYFHLWHHKHNGAEEDKESFAYAYALLLSPSRATRLFGFAWHISQLNHYITLTRRLSLAVIGRLRDHLLAETPQMPNKVANWIQQDYRILASVIAVAITVTLVGHPTILFDLWIAPMLIGYGPAHALIELPEHFLCDSLSKSVFENTRSIAGSWFSRWLTNANNHHVGHHDDSAMPMESLAEYERLLLNEYEFGHKEQSYPRFYALFLRRLWIGRNKRRRSK